MKHLRAVVLVWVILALASLACALIPGQARPTAPSEATPVQVTPTAVVQAEATATVGSDLTAPAGEEVATEAVEVSPEETAQPAATEAAGGEVAEEATLDLNAGMMGLEELNSYRAAFRFDWNGIKNGRPVKGYMEMRSAFVREPPAQELHFEGKGFEGSDDQGLSEVSFIQKGNTAWFYEGGSDTWIQVPAGSLDFSEGLFFQPEDLLEDYDVAQGRRSPVPQRVNGIECYKYTFNEEDFDLGGPSQGGEVTRAQGEAYVAVDGGYVVRLVIDADFRYADPEEVFEEGNVKMTFNISDVNQPITIEPPVEAGAQIQGREDVPLLPDAEIEFSSAEFTSYRTASAVADAAQFYQDEMPKQGWTADDSNMVFDQNALLNYTKDGQTANVIIDADQNGTSVLITITKE